MLVSNENKNTHKVLHSEQKFQICCTLLWRCRMENVMFLITVLETGAASQMLIDTPQYFRQCELLSIQYLQKWILLKTRAIWTTICAHKTQLCASACGGRFIFTDNYYTSNEFGRCLMEMTDGEMRLIGTIRLSYVESKIKSNLQQSFVCSKNAKRNQWALIRSFHRHQVRERGCGLGWGKQRGRESSQDKTGKWRTLWRIWIAGDVSFRIRDLERHQMCRFIF